ncbi:MAG: 6-phosphogluconolactonase [Planctomycetota bacterium]
MALPPIELEREPQAPQLRDTVAVRPALEEVLGVVASDVAMQAAACVREFGAFHLALSGGPMIERVCRELMVDPAYRSLPWRDTHVWTLDDAAVEHNDPASTYGMLRDLLVGHAGIPREHVHEIAAFRPAADAEYERALRRGLGGRTRGHDRLDMALLALDPSGIAGRLQPPHADADDHLVVRLPDAAVTMTPRMLSGSRFLGVLAIGSGVRGALGVAERGEATPVPELLGGHTRWYVDHDACADGA